MTRLAARLAEFLPSTSRALLTATLALSLPALAAPKKAPAPAKPAAAKPAATTPAPTPPPAAPASDLKKAPAPADSASSSSTAPAAATPTTATVNGAPTTRVIEAYGDATPKPAAEASAAAPAPEKSSRSSRLSLGVEGGVTAPLSVLTVGLRTGARVEYRLMEGGPLLLTFGAGYERHTGSASRLFSAPVGGGAVAGYDPNAIENQNLMPLELGVAFEAWHDDANALTAGASVGLLSSWTQTQALGATTSESALGTQVAVEAGYTRHLGALDLSLRGRWALRHTGAGLRSNAIELPWYQSVGAVLGLGVAL